MPGKEKIRPDKYLWSIRLLKTRTEAYHRLQYAQAINCYIDISPTKKDRRELDDFLGE